MLAYFQHEYEKLSDDELLQLTSDRLSLTEGAREVLDMEMRNRNLTSDDLAKHKSFVKRSERREQMIRGKKLFGNRSHLVDWIRFALWVLLGVTAAAFLALWLDAR
jgi:hypothetical protein